MDLDPLTESEMLTFYEPIPIFYGTNRQGDFVYWTCYCGKRCSVTTRQLRQGTQGGSCFCGRDLNIDRIDMSVIPIQPEHERQYTFPIIIDQGPSWRVWRKKDVGFSPRRARNDKGI